MQDERGFLEAIYEEPDSDELRLIFADWLEENGNPLGAVMRSQVGQDRLPPAHPLRAKLRGQASDADRRQAQRWLEQLRQRLAVPECRLVRGVVHVRGAGAEFLDALQQNPGLPDLAWISHVHLEASLELWPRLPLLETLPCLAELALFGSSLDEAGFRELGSLNFLSRLTALDLSGLAVNEALALLDSPHLDRLRSLKYRRSELGPEDLRQLLSARRLAQLISLDLEGNHLRDEGVRLLSSRPTLEHLQSLNLERNDIGTPGTSALGRSPYLDELTWLNLAVNRGDALALETLANSPDLARLRTLIVRDCPIGSEGLEVLASAREMRGLTTLEASYAGVGDRGAQALARSEALAELMYLDLSSNSIDDAGGRALARSPHLRQIQVLNLRCNRLEGDAAEELRLRFRERVYL